MEATKLSRNGANDQTMAIGDFFHPRIPMGISPSDFDDKQKVSSVVALSLFHQLFEVDVEDLLPELLLVGKEIKKLGLGLFASDTFARTRMKPFWVALEDRVLEGRPASACTSSRPYAFRVPQLHFLFLLLLSLSVPSLFLSPLSIRFRRRKAFVFVFVFVFIFIFIFIFVFRS